MYSSTHTSVRRNTNMILPAPRVQAGPTEQTGDAHHRSRSRDRHSSLSLYFAFASCINTEQQVRGAFTFDRSSSQRSSPSFPAIPFDPLLRAGALHHRFEPITIHQHNLSYCVLGFAKAVVSTFFALAFSPSLMTHHDSVLHLH
jgi:hypothetical protein